MRKTRVDEKITFALVGCGNRCNQYIKALNKYYASKYEIVAIAEPISSRREEYQRKYNISPEKVFLTYHEMFALPRLADVVIIATLDDMHFEPTMMAIEKNYDILLEKPISFDVDEILAIGKEHSKHPEQFIAICHVLRHAPVFRTIKEVIEANTIGKIMNIQHNENIGYYHFAHSYVRGNWRSTKTAAPLIVAKSCHDMDILLYLLQKKCIKLSSYGSLMHFNNSTYNADTMSSHCPDCPQLRECPYSAVKIYGEKLIRSVEFDTTNPIAFHDALRNSEYGRCVYACDNDVCSHQVTILEFEDGVTATFNLSAFTKKITRTLKIMGEFGEIRADDKLDCIEVTVFGKDTQIIPVHNPYEGDHNGADQGLIVNFMEAYINGKEFDSTLEVSIDSHIMAFAAENSRVCGGIAVDIECFKKKYSK